ncbi:NUDIX domain-containing protein [Caulobacter hibisci]|uniref:GDP-mannose pyrophosphatase n=1 Tax=Caulobacter hibisci TaxID=2035993 RepID=A0ABS0SUA2_9CAUL|nr:NUDIX hydrolase [Caulobacter hibisci]MBI1683230.1 NUDIX hydrolase [Caulobacter hibisci]
MTTHRIVDQDLVYSGWLRLHALTLESAGGERFRRMVEDHGSAVAVLPYDPERKVGVVVRLTRAPLLFTGTPAIVEVPAGLMDPGETAEAAARREALEETGLALRDVDAVGAILSMPGVSTESIALFLAEYAVSDRAHAGGGLAEEHEDIEVIERPLDDLWIEMSAAAPFDAKSRCLLQALRLRRPELFSVPV